MLWQVILASAVVGAISLVGLFLILRKTTFSQNSFKVMIGIASGVLLASVFLELLPEVFEKYDFEGHGFFLTMLLSILAFYLVERFIHWHHCHGASCPPENKIHVAVTNLVGDGIHNFVDGILIGAAFLVSPSVGIATTFAIIAHEIPQEISDAGVLLYAGLSKPKVIIYNLLFGLTSIIGAVLSYHLAQNINGVLPYFVAVAAGNFIYLALADLIPELHHEIKRNMIIKHTSWLLFGVLIFWLISLFFHH
jgi:zinc and cadmium transporter